MQFFKKQKIDKAGKLGVRLEKWLIFMAICDIVMAVFGLPYSLISLFFTLSILSIGFFGAYKRNRWLLVTYMVIRIIGVCLNVLAGVTIIAIVVLGGVFFEYAYETGMLEDYVDQYMDQWYGSSYDFTLDEAAVTMYVAIAAIVLVVLVIVYAIYITVVLYTVVLAGRMFGKLERSAIITEINAGLVSEKECEMQQMPAQPMVASMPMPQYIVAQPQAMPQAVPQAYAQPIYVQPADPTVFQKQ